MTDRWHPRRALQRGLASWTYRRTFLAVAASTTSFGNAEASSPDSNWIPADPQQPELFQRDARRLGDELTALWRRGDRTSLLPLARPMARLAAQARKSPLEIDREVSDDLYAMQ